MGSDNPGVGSGLLPEGLEEAQHQTLQKPIFKYAIGPVPPQRVWIFHDKGIKIYPEPEPKVVDEITFTPNPLYPFQQAGTKLRFKASGRSAVIVEPHDFGRTIVIEWGNGERSGVKLDDLKDAAEVVE
jgi:hypothetical protein